MGKVTNPVVVDAFREAFASLEIEGLHPTAADKDVAVRVARGDISFDDAVTEAIDQFTEDAG